MNEEINCITNKRKMAKNECENDVTLIFVEPYGVYKKLGHFFSIFTW